MKAIARVSAVIAAVTFTGSVALAQVPADVAEKLRAIGPVINPPATALGTDASRYAEQSSLSGLLRTRVPPWVP